jgi:hypothetical protein
MEELDDFSIWNINSVLTHIKDNMIPFILLICVFFIIYLVDRLTNYNMALMAASAATMHMPIPGSIPHVNKKRKGARFK